VQRSPERGEELGLDQPIVLVFDRAMDARSVEAAFALEPAVAGLRLAGCAHAALQARRAPGPRRRLCVQLGTGAAGQDGATLAEPQRLDFHTVGFLQVTQVLPAPDTADVEVDATIPR